MKNTGMKVVGRAKCPGRAARDDGRSEAVYSTGQVSYFCRAAPRTVSKWIDGGELLGYRLPGSMDRRVRKDDLFAFMRSSGIPTDLLEEGLATRVLWVGGDGGLGGLAHASAERLGLDDWTVRWCLNPLHAAYIAARWRPAWIVVDFVAGRSDCLGFAGELLAVADHRPIRFIALPNEDELLPSEDVLRRGYDAVLPKPFAVEQLVPLIRGERK